ncbi:MAG: hypothetical protein P9L94_13670 [Candidatus Hinthialibacter antarcticus]|nr:hypothetical protein [Candidatus Hinthialibacter antarcticus]
MKPAEALATIAQYADHLLERSFDETAAHVLLNLAAATAFRAQLGADRPALVGLIGCTGTGKSTLFNSFAEAEISETSWKAHNTCGPIALMHNEFLSRLQSLESQQGALLFPKLEREPLNSSGEPHATGSIARLALASTDNDRWRRLAALDLPDINTTLARDENLIAIELMVWLDAVIFLIDEETLFHRDYVQPAELAASLQQQRLCVLNNRGRDRLEREHPDIAKVQALFGAERLFVLSEIKEGKRFVDQGDFGELRESLFRLKPDNDCAPRARAASKHAASILKSNHARLQRLNHLEREMDESVQTAIRAQKPIPLKRIMNDEVISTLEHLGLKRFALSNIIQFVRRTAKTGSLSRSFQLAFGGNRESALESMLQFDLDKLCDAVDARLDQHAEAMQNAWNALLAEDEFGSLTQEFKPTDAFNKEKRKERLAELLSNLETQCRETLQTDSLKNALKNDPLSAGVILVVMLADIATIPGFGSFLITPSVLKYLPVGKFESIKRNFQQSVQTLVRDELRRAQRQVRDVQEQFTLDESSTVFKALKAVANKHED